MSQLKPNRRRNSALAVSEVSHRLRTIDGLKEALFGPQLQFILDPCKLKTAQCTRRAGKTYAAGIYLIHEALMYPRSTCLYLASTREQAKRILIKDVMIPLKRRFNLGFEYNKKDLSITLPNESVIYLLGLDSNESEMEKAYGQKYRLVMIDEAGMWKQDQRELVHSVLEPATADLSGTICLIGSPVPSTRTYFYDITGKQNPQDQGYVKGWSRHYWGWWDNPHTKEKIETLLARKVQDSPGFTDTTFYKNMYLNQWVTDTGSLVYAFDYNKNLVKGLNSDIEYQHILGIDLGYNDATAFVIWAHSMLDESMYVVYVEKKAKLDITSVAERVVEIQKKFDISRMVVDGASKQAVAELRERHGLPLEPADKRDKADFIEMMNADFVTGRLKVLDGAGDALIDEYNELTWFIPRNSNRRLENPNCENHASDAALYGWRLMHKYQGRANHYEPVDVDVQMDQFWQKESINAQRKQEEGAWARDFETRNTSRFGGLSAMLSRLLR